MATPSYSAEKESSTRICYRIESLRRQHARYAEFRDRLEDALQEAGLFFHDADRRVETIDLADTVRGWKSTLLITRRISPLPPTRACGALPRP
jgi:hypothetical protein